MTLYYTLDENKIPKPASFMEWAAWFNIESNRVIKQTKLPGNIFVSTVFVGLLSQFFETMIFGGEHDDYKEKYSTWEEAEAGHQRAIEMIFEVY